MSSQSRPFQKPGVLARLSNQAVGVLVRLGFGFAHWYLLEVRGRKSGKLYTTPVDLFAEGGKQYLVAPRGYTQWVRNAEAAGEVRLRKGRQTLDFQLHIVPVAERPPLLKEYLHRYQRFVQQFFPIPQESPVETFTPLAPSYPVFELRPKTRISN